jgi:two-component system, OmpR family, phosphate regulon sensor histidine kinase PhoR
MFRRLLFTFGPLVLSLQVAQGVLLSTPERYSPTVIVMLAVFGILAVWALSFGLAARVVGPVKDLTSAAERVGNGEHGVSVFPGDGDEVSDLGATFNRMSDRISIRIAQLEEDRQQLRTLLSGMVEGVVALDADQRIQFANERASVLLEFHGLQPVHRHLWEVVRHRQLLDAVRKALDGNGPCSEELLWKGTTPRSLTVYAARLPGSSPRGAMLVLHDTTELRRLERLRQDFVANVSHELKTPLSVIKVCTETLLDGAVDDPEHRGHFLEQIARQSDRLYALILDLLSLARIESGDDMFTFQDVAVGPLVDECAERHRTRALARQQQLLVDSSPPLTVWADEEALDQILENLLDNAVKYTPEGGTIRVSWKAEGSNMHLEVSDTGIGIPAADLPRIFERFYRVDKARSREVGGTGLGLSIVKHLLQGMRGSVRAVSQPGRGTTFTVILPLSRS